MSPVYAGPKGIVLGRDFSFGECAAIIFRRVDSCPRPVTYSWGYAFDLLSKRFYVAWQRCTLTPKICEACGIFPAEPDSDFCDECYGNRYDPDATYDADGHRVDTTDYPEGAWD